MLIVSDAKKLGDGQLCFKEAMAKAKEEDYKFLERYRLDDHDALKDIEARSGTRMHFAEFALKVQSIAPEIWVEQQINFPDDVGLYIADVGA